MQLMVMLPVVLFIACLIGGFFGIFVGNIIGYKKESHEQGEEALSRMWKALEVDTSASDEEPNSFPDASEQSFKRDDIQQKAPPA